MALKKQLQIRVVGKVQGVWFRAYTRNQAQSFAVTGYVRNCSDGSVCILAEGEHTALEKFTARIREGSAASHVSELEITEHDAEGHETFTISR